MKRASTEKPLPSGQAQAVGTIKPRQTPPAPPTEDWWLIRDEIGHVGWVLGRMLDVDIPLEIAQYAEGQRTVASFVLDQVTDSDKKVPQYLVLLTENKDGMPFDYNQVRVFTWERQTASVRNRLPGAKSQWRVAGDALPRELREGRRPPDISNPREGRRGQRGRTQVQAEYPDRASRAGVGGREDTSRDSSVNGRKEEKEALTNG
jgi:hypothetical protein